MRGVGQLDGTDDNNWVAAVTNRYKLIYHPGGKPWFFDLEKDPDEIINFTQTRLFKRSKKIYQLKNPRQVLNLSRV